MRARRLLSSCARFVAVVSLLHLASAAWPEEVKGEAGLRQILDRMNEFGRNFRSFRAEITQRKYVAALGEFEREERGVFYYARAKDGSGRLRKEISEPTPNIAVIDKGTAIVYEPRVKQARRIDLGKHRDKVEFLAIGIGQSPGKLQEAFRMRLVDCEILDGRRTALLELRPRSQKTSAFFSQIMLWVDAELGFPIQQKFVEPSRDYIVVKFSSVKVNAPIPEAAFKLKLPKGVEIIE